MRIRLDSSNRIHLDEPQDFRRFSVAIEPDAEPEALAPVADMADRETAWVHESALRGWAGYAEDPAWEQDITAMIEKAKPHGWYDEAGRRIKAHVEWLDGAVP